MFGDAICVVNNFCDAENWGKVGLGPDPRGSNDCGLIFGSFWGDWFDAVSGQSDADCRGNAGGFGRLSSGLCAALTGIINGTIVV